MLQRCDQFYVCRLDPISDILTEHCGVKSEDDEEDK